MKLYEVPFKTINFSYLSDDSYEFLSKIHKNNIDLKELHEEAQELYFLEGFSDALALELLDPSDDFVKAIFNRMQGKRITEQIKEKIKIQIIQIPSPVPFIEGRGANPSVLSASIRKVNG